MKPFNLRQEILKQFAPAFAIGFYWSQLYELLFGAELFNKAHDYVFGTIGIFAGAYYLIFPMTGLSPLRVVMAIGLIISGLYFIFD